MSSKSSDICITPLNTTEKDLTSRVNSLTVYYNLLTEKNQFLMDSVKELEEKFTKFKHKLYILSHKVCKHEDIISNMRPKCWIIENSREVGCNGGTAHSDIWTSVQFNTVKADSFISGNDKQVVLHDNIITLGPGSYGISVDVSMFRTGTSKIRLYSVTDDVAIEESLSTYLAQNTISSSQSLELFALLHVYENTSIRVDYIAQHRVENYGLGLGSGFNREVFARVKILQYY